MKVLIDPTEKNALYRFSVSPNKPEWEAALKAIQMRRDMAHLVQCAITRHGYADSNGGTAITYPGDLDEYDKAQGDHIPGGMLWVHTSWYLDDKTYTMQESDYLELLRLYLMAIDQEDLALQIEEKQNQSLQSNSSGRCAASGVAEL